MILFKYYDISEVFSEVLKKLNKLKFNILTILYILINSIFSWTSHMYGNGYNEIIIYIYVIIFNKFLYNASVLPMRLRIMKVSQ